MQLRRLSEQSDTFENISEIACSSNLRHDRPFRYEGEELAVPASDEGFLPLFSEEGG